MIRTALHRPFTVSLRPGWQAETWSGLHVLPRLSTRARDHSTAHEHPNSPSRPGRWPRFSKAKTYAQKLIGYVAGVAGVAIVLHVFTEHFYECGPAYGISMLPTLSSFGEWLVTSKHYRRGRDIHVGDLVSFRHPVKRESIAVKRVIGLPGDFVLQATPGKGEGRMIQIPDGHCWVVGDNLPHSRDSRHFGPLPMALVRGKIIARLGWPLVSGSIEPNFTPVDEAPDAD